MSTTKRTKTPHTHAKLSSAGFKQAKATGFPLLFAVALLLRILLACTYKGFASDTACFFSWAVKLAEDGFSNFYSPDYFCDYPPGYLYILWVQGCLMKLFGINSLSGVALLLLKTPAILCDMAAGYLIYRFAAKFFPGKTALILSACYLFHPAVITNSSLWGQVDAVFTLILLLVCILLSDRKPIPAYFLYALGILLKPQILMFAPLILCSLAEYIAAHKTAKQILTNLGCGVAALSTIVICSLPFGLSKVIAQYTETLSSYPYAAVNACNLWGLFGKNWISQDTKWGPFTYGQMGTFFIVAMTLLAFLLFYALRKREDRYYMTGAFLVISMFVFSVRMHERYMFPVMLLLLFALIHNLERVYIYHYWIMSLCHFGNVYYVLYYYDPQNYDRKSFPLLSLSFLTVLGAVLFYCSLVRTSRGVIETSRPLKLLEQGIRWLFGISSTNTVTLKASHSIKSGTKATNGRIGTDTATANRYAPEASRKTMPINKADILIMLAISLFYGIITFINLGITKTPVTECAFPYNTYLELEAEEGQSISSIYWYLLNEQDITCKLEIKKSSAADWEYVQDMELKKVFTWDGLDLPAAVSAVRITNLKKDTNIGELVFTDSNRNPVSIKQASAYYPLFDEQELFPKELNAQTGCYFDEIYYTRTVHEFINGLPTYENTHPPFGKVLITLGALVFGTSPFGFRFMGALFGVLMLPFMYLLGRNISGNRFLGGFLSFLFAFDFMHFAQTRLATIDVFVTLFIIVMYYFMEKYCSMSFYDTPLKQTWLPLGACGISFGFGVASKWTGAYAGAGLAILFFLQLAKRYREYRYALQHPNDSGNKHKHAYIIAHFKEYTVKTIGFCLIFFVVIPFCIYLLSYIPFVDRSHPGLVERMAANQVNMLNYHSNLTDTHPYSSTWKEWPTMIRPIFYYSKNLGENMRLGISSFGNPLVWWAGIPAFAITFCLALFRKQKTAIFLTIGYLAQYLPWTLVDRCTFIYHYFPCVPFVVLMIGYCFLQLKKAVSTRTLYLCCIAYAAAVFGLFLLFYPVLAGTPVSVEYVAKFLRWMDNWVLVLN